jgi:Type VI secretion system VasI, EvfG, VC_A0118
MTRLAAVLLASLMIVEARAQSASSTLKNLDECFARTRAAEVTCEQASDTTTRLECRLKAHSAEKQCLDRVFANKGEPRRPGNTPSELRSRAPPELPAVEQAPTAAEPGQEQETTAASPTSNGWLVGETTSPRDFTPLFVAKLYALPPVAADAPEILMLRCRSQRTEMSLGVNGVWRALRGGDVEVTLSANQPTSRPLRWRLAADGRTASMPEEATEMVRALRSGRTSISVTDGAGRISTAIFDLSGIDAVRTKLASACHWPNAAVESRGR